MPKTLRNHHRCLTLLEVLIVLALLGAMGAILVPVVIDRLDERAFEAAADKTSEQLLMARAHAQATGSPVEVSFSPTTGSVNARMYLPWNDGGMLDELEPGTSPLAFVSDRQVQSNLSSKGEYDRHDDAREGNDLWFLKQGGDDGTAHDRSSEIAESWATRVLGRGMRINTHPSFATSNGLISEEEVCLPDGTVLTMQVAAEDFETLEDLVHGQDVRLAVFMPDGSAMLGDDLWLEDDHGRCGKFSINAWSGLPVFRRLMDFNAGRSTPEALLSESAQERDGSAVGSLESLEE